MTNKHVSLFLSIIFIAGFLLTLQSCKNETAHEPGWPVVETETKPWTRWWWHGNALTKEGITAEMEAYQKAGLGGVEITPIYGVYGYEDKFVDFLSEEWMELLIHTLKEGERLGLGIDMATGTGWPFGGPWITEDYACRNVQVKVYEVKAGETLTQKVEFIQPPYLRAVGSQIYEVHDNAAAEGRVVQGSRKEPLMKIDRRTLDIKDLVEPISENKNLQALALDQVQFEKPLALQALIAYNDSDAPLDLTSKVDTDGKLKWTAPEGSWKLYAIFQGWHGKMVERAGPGGEGNVIDHFSDAALKKYLNRFDSVFQGYDISSLRSFFNDSYEVDDARGSADWTPMLFDEFKKRRGYDLRDHLPSLFTKDNTEKSQRILSDYRQTLSELLLSNFTQPWKSWAHNKSALVRNQAHGSPANILDLYAIVDIPEIEGVEPLRIKMASSAGNVTGKKLVSSESATWLNEHFESNLADIKIALDRFMLNGVNHIFYHGTSYSPPGEPWPGWLFYAAVHLNPRNPLWNDFDALNTYVAQCQSFLQNTKPDNDVLLYYPVYDVFAHRGPEMIEHFDGIGRQFENTVFASAAQTMLDKGYAFDYISDKQIENLKYEKNSLITEGNSSYRALVIPHCNYVPIETLKKIVSLAEKGADVILLQGAPNAVAGFANLENNKREFDQIIKKLMQQKKTDLEIAEIKMGSGRVLSGDSLDVVFRHAGIMREAMVDSGINFIRKKDKNGHALYLINNNNSESFEGWIPLQAGEESIVIYDPMSGVFGKGKVRRTNKSIEIFVQLTGKQSLIFESYNNDVDCEPFPYLKSAGEPVRLTGPWTINFTSGGPTLPPAAQMDSLVSWTKLGEEYEHFSGSATYSLTFPMPAQQAKGWYLDLGMLNESAEVIFNGDTIGTVIGPVYQLYIDPSIIKENNTLEVNVSNLMANRISFMDSTAVFWKKFYNVNFPSRKAENRKNGLFTASHWLTRDSGLIGPVMLRSATLE